MFPQHIAQCVKIYKPQNYHFIQQENHFIQQT